MTAKSLGRESGANGWNRVRLPSAGRRALACVSMPANTSKRRSLDKQVAKLNHGGREPRTSTGRSEVKVVSMQEQAPYFVGWGTLSLINAGLAQAKGRSGLAWWLISILLGPVATFLIVVLPEIESQP